MKERNIAFKRQRENSGIIPLLAFIFIVIGVKIAVIANYGSSIPYWDQWDTEADTLFVPWLKGTLQWTDFFRPYMDHRIFTTKALDFLLFILNRGVWDPMLEMYVNAVIHSIALIMLLIPLSKGLNPYLRIIFFIFATFLFAVPYGHQSLLWTNGSVYYFVIFFSVLCLWSVCRFRTGSEVWLIVIVFSAFMSFYSLASGVITIAAGVGTLLIRWACGVEKTRKTGAIIFFLSAALILGLCFTPSKSDSTSLIEFFVAILFATAGGLLYIPVFLYVNRRLRETRPVTDHSWFVIAVSLWSIGQILATAWSRGAHIYASRYLDIMAIGVLINGYCLLSLLQELEYQKRLKNFAYTWFFIIVCGLLSIIPSTVRCLENKKTVSLHQRNNVSSYLSTGNYAFLQKEPTLTVSYKYYYSLFRNKGGILVKLKDIAEYLHNEEITHNLFYLDFDRLNSLFEYLENKTPGQEIPYPDNPKFLKSLLDNQLISSILTPEVNSYNTNKGLGLYTKQSKEFFILLGICLCFFGITFFIKEAITLKHYCK